MPTAESYVTPHIKALFKPQFATQDPDIYAVLLKTWQDFVEGAHPLAQGHGDAARHAGDGQHL